MKKTNLRKSKGITLIALVITIIILLILAGVAISMLSGENGILKKAAEAKTKTEEGQKQEETTLEDMDLDSYFILKNAKYKCRYGYVTGIYMNEDAKELKQLLKDNGYELKNIENTSEVASDATLTTGMAVVKNGNIIAGTVIFGEPKCSEGFELDDVTNLSAYVLKNNAERLQTFKNIEDYVKVAMDVNHDGIIDANDSEEITRLYMGQEDRDKTQLYYVKKVDLSNYRILSDNDLINQLQISSDTQFSMNDDDVYEVTLNDNYTYAQLEEKVKNVMKNSQVKFKDNNGDEIEEFTSTDTPLSDYEMTIITSYGNNNTIAKEPYIYIKLKK